MTPQKSPLPSLLCLPRLAAPGWGVTPMNSPAQRRKPQGWRVASLRGSCSMVQILRPHGHGALASSSSTLVRVETQRSGLALPRETG